MKGKKLLTALLLLAVAGTATAAVTLTACGEKKEPAPRAGKTYYISPDGGNARVTAGTEDDPWEAWSGLQNDILDAGDTVIVKPGVYDMTERITIFAEGNYNNYINIVAEDPTKETVFSFYQMTFDSTHRGVQIYGNYVHWNGIDIRGAGDNGMYIGGNYNIIENSRFYDNRDTGLQLGRNYSPTQGDPSTLVYDDIAYWPSYNLIKNCTSFNNYDNETYGENADGFAAKLTVGYGNVFDGCIAYRNSDDGWDLYAKTDSGNIGEVIIYNCVAFENGFILETQEEFNNKCAFNVNYAEENTNKYTTRDGDGNGFKLGGSVMEGEVLVKNCLSFNNRMHGITDNSNPGVIIVDGVTCYNNGANVDASGKIVYTSNGVDEGSANVDLARHYYSYNHIANVLSINNGNNLISTDAYRGTVENSTFNIMSKSNDGVEIYQDAYEVNGQAEYYSKNKDYGKKLAALPDATQIFKALPTDDMGIKRQNPADEPAGVDGDGTAAAKGALWDWHTALRNEDMSINVGDLLALKDPTGTQGCKLSYSSWEDYDHYGMHDLTKCKSKNEAIAQAVIDMVYVPIRTEALYQNFDAVTKIKDYTISWKSSNTNILKVTDIKGTSNSKHQDVLIEVTRPIDKDTEVTLTASVKVGKVKMSKSFVINVKRNTYRVTENGIVIDGLVAGNVIKDMGDSKFAFRIEDPIVLNDTSDSGEIIGTSNYTLNTFTRFATYSAPNDWQSDVSWDATKAGIWEVTVRVTLKDSVQLAKKGDGSYNDDGTEVLADSVIERTYYLYVADESASNAFVADSDEISVNKDGFVITGDFVSPTGMLYAVAKSASDAAPTAAQIKADANAQKTSFRTTGGSFQFLNENSAAYKVYYFIESVDGSAASSVYDKTVNAVNIASKKDFEDMLADNNNHTLYLQTQDIDMTGSITLTNEKNPFRGVFNGNGYTISNVSIKQTGSKEAFGLFAKVKGGTIMNANFENVVIDDNGANEKTGLIGEMEGGFIYNVSIHNIDVNANFEKRVSIRVGALIGQIFSTGGTGATTYIQNVSIINDKVTNETTGEEEYAHTIRGDQRVGGIAGFIQSGSGTGWNIVYVDNCYVNAKIESNTYGGGIIGRSDDRNITGVDLLEITRCYFAGDNYTQKYCGGILGGNSGAGTTKIVSCVSTGRLFYTDEAYLETSAEKNCSHMIGYYASNGNYNVMNCYAPFIDHNTAFLVTGFHSLNDETGEYFASESDLDFWQTYLNFQTSTTKFSTVWDFEKDWELVTNRFGSLVSPYVQLRINKVA